MDINDAVVRLGIGRDTIQSLVGGVTQVQARWKPAPKKWSILEVVNHLIDEECEDFRQRVDILLHRPNDKWPPIDPVGWVTSRQYNEQDIGMSLQRFIKERDHSIAWVKGLDPLADWNQGYEHPQLGLLRAGDMFASWLVHDHLHVRQLANLHFAYLKQLMEPFSTNYAAPA